MRRVVLQLWDLLRDRSGRRPRPRKARPRPITRLQVRAFEERVLPSASPLGTVSGIVYVDGNGNGIHDANEAVVPGVEVTLSQNGTVEMTTTTDAQGSFAFRSVQPGSYQLTALPGAEFVGGDVTVSGLSVVAGQNTSQEVGIGGLAPGAVHLTELLSTTTPADFPFQPAGPTSNSPPFVLTPIANITLASNSSQTIDLAANFSDPNITNSQVEFDTSDGDMIVNLFDAQAPQTVANFFDYVQTDRYNDTIFHRLDTSPPVLQGGGFSLATSGGAVTGFNSVANSSDPLLQDEATSSAADTLGTLAMAQPGNNANGATSEFFFNLANNSSSLAGNFAVFGSVASDPTSQAVFTALQTPTATLNTYNESTTNSAFTVLPLSNYTGEAANTSTQTDTSFPGDTTPSNYLQINNITILKQDVSLTYTASSNSSAVSVGFVADHPEVLNLTASNSLTQTTTATITVTATDQFGASVDTTFQVTVVPVSITSVTNPVNSTDEKTTSASGTVEAGATVSVTANDGAGGHTSASVPAVVTGTTWTASNIDVSSLADGTITYVATATDAAGNTATTSLTATKDTVAPAVTISSVTNPVNSTNETTTSASGTVEAGATVSVVANDGAGGHTSASVTAVVTGTTWTASNIDVSGLNDGTITYVVTATDATGNTATTSLTATKDTVAPAVAISSVTNPVNSTDQTTTSASGTVEAGATVSVVANDGAGGHSSASVTAVVTGTSWTASNIDVSGLADGTITYVVTATDAAGNTATTSLTATKDTVAPAVAISSVTDPVNSANQTTTSASGTVEIGATVSVTANDGAGGHTSASVPAVVDGSGNWTASNIDVSGLNDGTITYVATATDAAGNMATNSLTATKNTAA